MGLDAVLLIARVDSKAGREAERHELCFFQDTTLRNLNQKTYTGDSIDVKSYIPYTKTLAVGSASKFQTDTLTNITVSSHDKDSLYLKSFFHSPRISKNSVLLEQIKLPIPDYALFLNKNDPQHYLFSYKPVTVALISHNSSYTPVFKGIAFENHVGPMRAYDRVILYPDWLTGLLILSLVLLTWSKTFFGKYFQLALYSLFDFQLSARLFRDKNVLLRRVTVFLLSNFIFTGALFIYKGLELFNPAFFKATFYSFIIIALFLFMILAFKYISIYGLTFLFPGSGVLLEYHYQIQNFYKGVGIIIMPFVIGILYMQTTSVSWLLWAGISLILLLYINRINMGRRIIKRIQVSGFYLLLYLFTFEVLPVLLIIRFISNLA